MRFEEINRKLSLLALIGVDDSFHIDQSVSGIALRQQEGYHTTVQNVIKRSHNGKQLSLFN